jgi:hypothetical protein
MVLFSEKVIREIKCAVTEKELREIINNSLSGLRTKNLYNEGNYTMYMILSLQAAKAEPLTPDVLRNLNIAIEMFWEYRRQNPEPLF